MNTTAHPARVTASGRLQWVVSALAVAPLATIFVPPIIEIPKQSGQLLYQAPLITLLGPAVVLFLLVGALVWRVSARVWWVLGLIAGVVLGLATGLAKWTQGEILWDGIDAQGNPTGGFIDFVPGPGYWLCMVTAVGMLIAAILARPPRPRAAPTPSA